MAQGYGESIDGLCNTVQHIHAVLQSILACLRQQSWFPTCVLNSTTNQSGQEVTVEEQREAARLLQGIVLLDERARSTAIQHGIVLVRRAGYTKAYDHRIATHHAQILVERAQHGPTADCLDALAVFLASGNGPVGDFIRAGYVAKLLTLLQVPDMVQRRACVQFFTVLLSAVLPQWLSIAANHDEATVQVVTVKQEIAAIFGTTNVERMSAASLVGQRLLETGDVNAVGAHMDDLVGQLLLSLSH